jgi:hypothetical protein
MMNCSFKKKTGLRRKTDGDPPYRELSGFGFLLRCPGIPKVFLNIWRFHRIVRPRNRFNLLQESLLLIRVVYLTFTGFGFGLMILKILPISFKNYGFTLFHFRPDPVTI